MSTQTLSTALHVPALRARTRPTALEATLVLATAGLAAMLAEILVTSVQAPEVAATVGVLGAASIGAILTGRRWTPLVGSLFALVAIALVVGPAPDGVARALAQPADPLFFPLLVLLPLAVLGIVSGAAATIQNLHHDRAERSRPRWLLPLLAASAGIAACGGLLTVVPHPASSQGVSPAVLASLPALRTSGFAFDQEVIHARAGETLALRLENGDGTTHTFTVDELGVDVPILPGQSSLAVMRPTQPGTYTFYCSPHYDRATGQGMHGTVVVE